MYLCFVQRASRCRRPNEGTPRPARGRAIFLCKYSVFVKPAKFFFLSVVKVCQSLVVFKLHLSLICPPYWQSQADQLHLLYFESLISMSSLVYDAKRSMQLIYESLPTRSLLLIMTVRVENTVSHRCIKAKGNRINKALLVSFKYSALNGYYKKKIVGPLAGY